MQLHEELRKGREEMGWTQAELASRAGIPRNQVVRAEKGDNITLETLRKIAIHLPLENLTLLESQKLQYDIVPHPEKLFIRSMESVRWALEAFHAAIQTAMAARAAVNAARRAAPLPGSEPGGDVEDLLLKSMNNFVKDAAAKLKEIA